MTNLLTLSELSKFEGVTNPTRTSEEIKNDDMENIFKVLKSNLNEIDDEKAAAKAVANSKIVYAAINGINDLKKVIRELMVILASKRTMQGLLESGYVKRYIGENGEYQRVSVDIDINSPAMSNKTIEEIYSSNGIRAIREALNSDETSNALHEERNGCFKAENDCNFTVEVDGHLFKVHINDGWTNGVDKVDMISFLIH